MSELEDPPPLQAIARDAELPEPVAWAAVEAAWGDDAAHRAYLARFRDLEGLAVAGGRYRAVLALRPGDPVAERWRAEVVKRATVAGLALLPRTRARPSRARIVRAALLALAAALALAVALTYAGPLLRGLSELLP